MRRWFSNRERPGTGPLPAPIPAPVPAELLAERLRLQHDTELEAHSFLNAALRAEELFVAHLNSAQREQFLRTRRVDVVGSESHRVYTIALGESNTFHEVWCEEIGGSFCVHAYGYPGDRHSTYLAGDNALAILLTIRHREMDFLAVAVAMPRPSSFRYQQRYVD